jgi:hypothetical protein
VRTSGFTTPLDELFLAGPWRIAIGDGGNEIGMGSPPASLINIARRDHCATPAISPIVAGVSNWAPMR